MKNQALFFSKDKNKKMKMWSAAIFVWRFKGELQYTNNSFIEMSKVQNHCLRICKCMNTVQN